MSKAPYIPKDDASKGPWLSNFAQKLPEHAAAVGVTPAEVASVAADNTFWAYVYDAQNQIKNNAQEWTAYKNGLRSGPAIGELPTLPTLGPAPAEVAAEIFGRIAALVARIKNHPGYTESIGQDHLYLHKSSRKAQCSRNGSESGAWLSSPITKKPSEPEGFGLV
jgi:hypothetical protein